MWLLKWRKNLWQVGYYTHEGAWFGIKGHGNFRIAAAWVNYLNGGNEEPDSALEDLD